MQTFIVYQGEDEQLITTPEAEAAMLPIYFIEGGRKLEDYDREEYTSEAIQVTVSMRSRG